MDYDEYHSSYIMDIHSNNPMKDIGLNYIQFAVKGKNLFRFLFQSNEFLGKKYFSVIILNCTWICQYVCQQ